jgi:hypothetical protein
VAVRRLRRRLSAALLEPESAKEARRSRHDDVVLGLDRKMLAGHKRYAPIAAALRRRPAGGARHGKHRERGRGKRAFKAIDEKEGADLVARPTGAALAADFRRSLEGICQSSARSPRGSCSIRAR